MLYTVRQARAMAGKTQVEMAKSMGISRDTYRGVEKNPERATVAQARQISAITAIPLDQIFFADDSTFGRREVK